MLENYLEIEKLRFEEDLDYKISVDPNLEIEEVSLPSMLLQPLVENSINHGLFHKKGAGYVHVNFLYVDKNTFQVKVIDNGVGLNHPKNLNSVLQAKKEVHSSEILKERLHYLNKSSNWEVTFTLKDREEIENSSGVVATLTFTKNEEDEN